MFERMNRRLEALQKQIDAERAAKTQQFEGSPTKGLTDPGYVEQAAAKQAEAKAIAQSQADHERGTDCEGADDGVTVDAGFAPTQPPMALPPMPVKIEWLQYRSEPMVFHCMPAGVVFTNLEREAMLRALRCHSHSDHCSGDEFELIFSAAEKLRKSR